MDETEGFVDLDENTAVLRLKAEIQKQKEKYSSLIHEVDELEKEKCTSDDLAGQLQDSMDKQKCRIYENEKELKRKEEEHKGSIRMMEQKNQRLEEETQLLREKIGYFEKEAEHLNKIFLSERIKKMVFKGNVSNNVSSLSFKHQIKYPVNGGSALITFQNPSVAAQIISAQRHTVNVEECWVHVKSEAIELSVVDAVCMKMSLSPTKILIYNLPSGMKEEIVMDKLELFFGKSKNGGGEVEKREFLSDCQSVILTFIDKDVASRLVAKKFFPVPFGDFDHKVCVAPSLEGSLQNHKMRKLECNRTVLVTGIPDIKDKDTLRDLLEIHFQKPSNGGGEVQELMYCPEGEHVVALFEDDEDAVPLTE